jgi:hypothetical protein
MDKTQQAKHEAKRNDSQTEQKPARTLCLLWRYRQHKGTEKFSKRGEVAVIQMAE